MSLLLSYLLATVQREAQAPTFHQLNYSVRVSHFDRFATIIAKHTGGEGRCLLVGLSNGERQWVVSLGTIFGPGPGIFNVDGKVLELDEATKKAQGLNDTPGTFVFSVRKTGFSALLDGHEVIDWSGDSKRLSAPDNMGVSHKNTLFLGTPSCRYEIQKATLTPITGQGQRLK